MKLEDVLSCNEKLPNVWGQSNRKRKTFLLDKDILDEFTNLCKDNKVFMTQIIDKAMLEVIELLKANQNNK